MADTTQATVEEVTAPETGPMDFNTALQEVLKKALIHDGLKRGLRECVRALDRRVARVCCLAADCDEPNYVRLVRALCKETNTPLIMVDEGKQLGEWAGLCRRDAEGNAAKVVRCSACAVTDFGEETDHLQVLLNSLKQ